MVTDKTWIHSCLRSDSEIKTKFFKQRCGLRSIPCEFLPYLDVITNCSSSLFAIKEYSYIFHPWGAFEDPGSLCRIKSSHVSWAGGFISCFTAWETKALMSSCWKRTELGLKSRSVWPPCLDCPTSPHSRGCTHKAAKPTVGDSP